MHFQDVKQTVIDLIPTKKPILILGAPGVGKSALCREVATELSFDSFIDIRGTTLRPPDLRGLMYLDEKNGEKTARFAPMSLLPRSGRHLILFDELPTCSQEVQAALYQLLLDRKLGEYIVPDETVILAAGNRQEHRAGASRILTPLATRFITTLSLTSDLKNWLQWAIPYGILPEIVAFLHLNPTAINNFDPKIKADAYASERSWENASDVLNRITGDRLRETLAGSIGSIAGESFYAFLQIYATICKIPDIIDNPTNYPVPSDPAQLYSVTSALSYAAEKCNLTAILQYANRLPSELQSLFSYDFSHRHADLTETQEYCMFAAENSAAITI